MIHRRRLINEIHNPGIVHDGLRLPPSCASLFQDYDRNAPERGTILRYAL
jgi:hypothetical protein